MFVSVGLPVDRVAETGQQLDDVSTCAQAAERHGFGAVFVTDHPAPDAAWLERGHPTLDPFVTLAFAGAATERIRLHTNLMVLGYRNPLLAAKAVASLDLLSKGRVLLGVGVGYLRAEFDALGANFTDRARIADDHLGIMTSAFRGEPVTHAGDGYRAVDTVIQPRPVQQPYPPIWVGGNSAAAMRRAVSYGQGWSPMPSTNAASGALGTPGIEDLSELARRVSVLHRLAAEAGRHEPLDVAVIPTTMAGFASAGVGAGSWDVAEVLDEIGRLREAGGTSLVVNLPGRTVGAYLEEMDRFAEGVLSRI